MTNFEMSVTQEAYFINAVRAMLEDLKNELKAKSPTHPLNLYHALVHQSIGAKLYQGLRNSFSNFFEKNPSFDEGLFDEEKIVLPGKMGGTIYIPLLEISKRFNAAGLDVFVRHLRVINAILNPTEENMKLIQPETRNQSFTDILREKTDPAVKETEFILELSTHLEKVFSKLPTDGDPLTMGFALLQNKDLLKTLMDVKGKLTRKEITIQGLMAAFRLEKNSFDNLTQRLNEGDYEGVQNDPLVQKVMNETGMGQSGFNIPLLLPMFAQFASQIGLGKDETPAE